MFEGSLTSLITTEVKECPFLCMRLFSYRLPFHASQVGQEEHFTPNPSPQQTCFKPCEGNLLNYIFILDEAASVFPVDG